MEEDKKNEKEMDAAVSLIGTWSGTIEVPGQPLGIMLKFEEKGDAVTGMISIPVQNVEDFTLTNIRVEEGQVSFDMPLSSQSIHFSGTVKSVKIEGRFTQNGQCFPFKVEKGKDISGEEKENFLSIDTANGVLYGSLLTPEMVEASPVALIIPGSGPTNRNGNFPGAKNDSLKMLAEELAKNGVASLRYDKRGAGKNVQAVVDEKEMRFEQFVSDAKRWVTVLQQDDRFMDIIVIGHSQGSLVGMMVAADSDVDVFISIAGPGRSIDQVISKQLKTLPNDLYQESQKVLNQMRQGVTVDDVDEQLQNMFRPSVQPFLISWMGYDPAQLIEQLTIPSLIINGKNDLQVSMEDAKKLAKASSDAELLLIDQMNHVLKGAPVDQTGNAATYSDPTLPLADGLMDGIIAFLDHHDLLGK